MHVPLNLIFLFRVFSSLFSGAEAFASREGNEVSRVKGISLTGNPSVLLFVCLCTAASACQRRESLCRPKSLRLEVHRSPSLPHHATTRRAATCSPSHPNRLPLLTWSSKRRRMRRPSSIQMPKLKMMTTDQLLPDLITRYAVFFILLNHSDSVYISPLFPLISPSSRREGMIHVIPANFPPCLSPSLSLFAAGMNNRQREVASQQERRKKRNAITFFPDFASC